MNEFVSQLQLNLLMGGRASLCVPTNQSTDIPITNRLVSEKESE